VRSGTGSRGLILRPRGAIAGHDARIVLWGIAVVAGYGAAFALHWLPGRGRRIDLRHSEVAGGHILERFGLFFIILLGETVLTMGNAFADQPFEADRLLALLVGFTGTVALWGCYFQRSAAINAQATETADAGAIGWWGTWTLTLVVLGVLAIAVGDEMAIAGPGDDATVGFTLLTFGGPALFLLAQLVFLGATLDEMPRSRPLGLAALGILAVATTPLSLLVGVAASTAVLVGVAAADTAASRIGGGGRG